MNFQMIDRYCFPSLKELDKILQLISLIIERCLHAISFEQLRDKKNLITTSFQTFLSKNWHALRINLKSIAFLAQLLVNSFA